MLQQQTQQLQSIYQALQHSLELDHRQARSMPAAFYTDADFLELEREQVFRRQWVCLGRVEEVASAGDYFTTDLIGEPLLIVRGEDEQIRVLSNVCRHRGMPVANGSGNSQRFQCPYHAWTYANNGALLRTPGLDERPDFKRDSCRLPMFNSTVWRGFIFVNLDGEAAPLEPRLSGLEPLVQNYHMEDMLLRYSKEEIWPTNWKILTENFMEGYHLSTVHYETLHPVTPTRLCEYFPAGEAYFGYFSKFPADLPRRGHYHPDLSAAEHGYSVMFAVPPGLVSGVAGHMTAYICLQPVSVDTVRAKMGMTYLDHNIEQAALDDAIALFERTMAEDKEQLFNLQRGLGSHYYQPGPLAGVNYEGTVWDFYRYLARCLLNGQDKYG